MSDPSGIGGRQREATIMGQVDEAVGGPKHPAATPTNPTSTRPAPPPASSMAPSGDKGPRVYGSPIEGNAPSQ